MGYIDTRDTQLANRRFIRRAMKSEMLPWAIPAIPNSPTGALSGAP